MVNIAPNSEWSKNDSFYFFSMEKKSQCENEKQIIDISMIFY